MEDLAQAHILALQHQEKFQIFNCGYNQGYSVLEVVQALEKIINKKLNVKIAPKRAGDITKMIADNSKITKQLDWSPKHNDLNTICKTAYEWERAISK